MEFSYEEVLERVLCEMLATNALTKEDYDKRMKGFEKLYLFSNENLGTYYKRLDLKGKRVLTVGSSGDQILYSLYYGADEVVCYDICPLSKYYFDLKVACIKNFSFEEFNRLIDLSKMIFSEEVYVKVSHDIKGESRRFWDSLYLEGFNDYDYDINRLHWKHLSKDVYTNNEEIYTELQSILKSGVKVRHMCGDVRDIPQKLARYKFDAIMLSNIAHYVKNWNVQKSEVEGQSQFHDLVLKLGTILSEGGFVQLDYAYNDRLKRYKKYADFYGKDKIKTATAYGNEGAIIYYPEGKNNTSKQKEEESSL